MSRCMKLCERSVFAGNEKYYDMTVRMGDDFHLIYPAFLNSTRVVVMEQAFYYHYRYVGDSIVHGYDAGMYRSVEAWLRAMERIVADKGVKDGEEKLRREYCYMLMLVMKNELKSRPGLRHAYPADLPGRSGQSLYYEYAAVRTGALQPADVSGDAVSGQAGSVAAADGLKAARQRLSRQGSIQSRKQRIKTANKDKKIQKIQSGK